MPSSNPRTVEYEIKATRTNPITESLLVKVLGETCNDFDLDSWCGSNMVKDPQPDKCPENYDPANKDIDQDGVGDLCDNCKDKYNPPTIDTDGSGIPDKQADSDGDGIGDACDATIKVTVHPHENCWIVAGEPQGGYNGQATLRVYNPNDLSTPVIPPKDLTPINTVTNKCVGEVTVDLYPDSSYDFAIAGSGSTLCDPINGGYFYCQICNLKINSDQTLRPSCSCEAPLACSLQS